MATILIKVFYRLAAKPLFFMADPELVHNRISVLGNFLGKRRIAKKITRSLLRYENRTLEQNIFGITFPNPVGLSAGFDKDANLTNILQDVGFGFMEVGSVTLRPYGGNPKPRLYRLPASRSLVVNYGLKNIGADKIIEKIKRGGNGGFIKIISIAKTNSPETVETESGIEDYFQCLKKFAHNDIGDAYEINISCPNTFGGEPFTTPDKLDKLLARISELKIAKPILLKMPVNLEWDDFEKLLETAVRYRIDGVTIGNLSKNRSHSSVKDRIPEHIKGGLSGKPTWDLSNYLISQTFGKYGNRLVIIGCGGIFSAEDAYHKIKSGASLVELITGMVYQGPQLIGEINKGLANLLAKDGYSNIQEAVGAGHRS